MSKLSVLLLTAFSAVGVTAAAQVAATPLVETFIGQWCPCSPRGIVAMDRMQAKYPDKFVGLLYHIASKDGRRPGLLTVSPNPHNIVNSPVCAISRNEIIDPYYGNYGVDMGVETDWTKYCATEVPAKVEVKLEQTSADVLTATAKVSFLSTPTSGLYRVAFVLVADSVTTEAFDNRSGYVYGQRNNYGSDEKLVGADWETYTKGASTVSGIKYNNVVLQYEEPFLGRTLAINPETMSAYSMSHSFNLTGVTNIYGDRIPVPNNRYRVVAIVSDGSGYYVNCAKSGYPSAPAGVDDNVCTKEAAHVVYHDIHGRTVTQPQPGQLYIETTTYTDGSRTTRKLRLP